jgi:uncharacterized phage protein (TIGR01671 family)
MKLRVFDLAGGDMEYNMNKLFKNPSVLPSEVLSGEDPLLKVMMSTERVDKNGTEIFQGDIVEFVNAKGITMRAVCEFSSANRMLVGYDSYVNECEIQGFNFRLLELNSKVEWVTFPIVKNYKEVSDYELFEVIGNIYQNPELVK